MARYQDQIVDENNVPIAGATIWVFVVVAGANNGQQATLTDDLGNPIIQPLTSDINGLFYYNTTDGVYENQVHYGGQLRYVQQVLVGQAVGTWQDGNKGDITVSGGGVNWQINPGVVDSDDLAAGAVATANIANGAVGLPQMANVNSGTLFYRKSAGAGPPEVNTLATLKTDLGLSGNNSGDQTITLTGDVTGSGTGSFPAAIAAGAVTLAKMAALPAATIIGSIVGGTPTALTAAQATSILAPFSATLQGVVPASGGGSNNFLRADGTWATPLASGSVVTSFNTRTGAVTLTSADVTTALTFTPANAANVVASFNSRTGAVTLTGADVTGALGFTPASNALFTTSANGLAPQSPGGSTTFLRADGTWAVPAGGGSGGGGAAWGTISGTLSDQTDLQTALNAKANLATANLFTGGNRFKGQLTIGSESGETGADTGVYFDNNNYYGTIYFRSTNGNANGTMAQYGMLETGPSVGAWYCFPSHAWRSGDGSALYGSITSGGFSNYGANTNLGPQTGAAADNYLTLYNTNYYNFISFQSTNGGGAMAQYGQIFSSPAIGIRHCFSSHQFYSGDASTSYASITPSGYSSFLSGGFVGPFSADASLQLYTNNAYGAVLAGRGSLNDICIMNRAGAAAILVPANTQNVNFPGNAAVTGTLAATGAVTTGGSITTGGELALNYGSSAAIRFAGAVGSAHYLTYSSFNFTFSDPLTVNGPISCSGGITMQGGQAVAFQNPQIQTVASAANVSPGTGNDQVNITALAVALTLTNPAAGNPDGWGWSIRIKDNGGARSITFGSQYRAIGVVLPTTTVAGKVLYLGCIWNAQDSLVDVVAVAQQ